MKQPLIRVETSATRARDIALYILEDQYHPVILGGNKRFKLSENLKSAVELGYRRVISFGGVYSNHIHALAWAAQELDLQSVGIIRGEASDANTATLRDASNCGMQLQFASRSEYRKRYDKQWLSELQARYPDALLLPEGGSNLQAVAACQHMLDTLTPSFLREVDVVSCAAGTGATACGISLALSDQQKLRAYEVVADRARRQRMQSWLTQLSRDMHNIELILVRKPEYGQLDTSLCEFIDGFYAETGVLLDPLYTSKMMRQLLQEIEQHQFASGQTVVAIHTGGLQGWRGFLPGLAEQFSDATLAAVRQQTDFT